MMQYNDNERFSCDVGLINFIRQYSLLPEMDIKALLERLEQLDRSSSKVTQSNLFKHTFLYQACQQRYLDPELFLQALELHCGFPKIGLMSVCLKDIAQELFDVEMIKKYQIIPLQNQKNKRQFTIICSNPLNLEMHQYVQRIIKKRQLALELKLMVEYCVANVFAVEAFIQQNFQTVSNKMISASIILDDVIQMVDDWIRSAVMRRASDIHFESYEHCYRVRFRIDGVMFQEYQMSVNEGIQEGSFDLSSKISARLKIISNLDIAEKRLPQDGSFRKYIDGQQVDFRVSACPTLFGEKIVLRILEGHVANREISALGFESAQENLYLQALQRTQGMILVTGPTGSGKTATLYSGLSLLNEASRNISTVEDPVEMHLSGINQVNINVKAGLTFPNILRAFLRQDPDVLMVGEIRDYETASIAIKAAQTGHLVLSTLHTNSALETLNRLLNMKIEPYNIVGTVSLIIAQRLAKKLCTQCKKAVQVAPHVLERIGFTVYPKYLYEASLTGCNVCCCGIHGRVAIHEVLPITEGLKNIILEDKQLLSSKENRQRYLGMDLRQAGIQKVLRGDISISELLRVTEDNDDKLC